MKMPFGKYKNHTVENIALCDPDYLIWLAGNCDLREPLKSAVYRECAEIDLNLEYIAQIESEQERDRDFGDDW